MADTVKTFFNVPLGPRKGLRDHEVKFLDISWPPSHIYPSAISECCIWQSALSHATNLGGMLFLRGLFIIQLCVLRRAGQNRIDTPDMTVYLVISLPKIPYIHRVYMVLANPSLARPCKHLCWTYSSFAPHRYFFFLPPFMLENICRCLIFISPFMLKVWITDM